MPLLTYTLLRLGFMFAVGVVLYLLGVRSWLLLALSILMGAGLSYVLLARPRQSAAEDLERRTGGRPTRLERAVDADAEDEDAQLAGAGAGTPSRAASADEHRHGQGESEHDADGQLQHPGAGQDPDQVRAPGAGQDPAGEQHRG